MWASGAAKADTWVVTPSVAATVSATDNVDGSPPGQEEADLIVSVSPAISIRGTGARVQTNLSYSLSRDEFLRTENSDFRQNLVGFGRAELLEDMLFFESEASISVQATNQTAALAAGDRALRENQTQVTSFRAGPVIRHRFGSWVDTESRYRFSHVAFKDLQDQGGQATPSDTLTHSLSQRVIGGTRFSRLLWSLDTSTEITERADQDGNFERSTAQLSGEYVITRQISAIGRVGYEVIDDPSLNNQNSPDGAFWTVGARWRPGPRTDLRAEFGRRFGDRFWNGSGTYRFSPATVLSVSYDQTVQTTQSTQAARLDFLGEDAFGNIIDVRTGLPPVPGDPAFDLTDQDTVFINKAFNASLGGTRGRARYALTAFRTTRESLPGGETQTSTGASANLGWQLTRISDLAFSSSYRATTEDTGNDTDIVSVSLAWNYTLSDTVSGTTSYVHLRRMSDNANDRLQENTVSFSLRKAF